MWQQKLLLIVSTLARLVFRDSSTTDLDYYGLDSENLNNKSSNVRVSSSSKMILLGSTLGQSSFDISYYYVSVNPAAWNNAEEDCQKVFKTAGKTGDLVSFESVRELQFVQGLLEKFGSGYKYWTSGLFAGGWYWASTEERIASFALPASDPKPTDQDRLVLDYENRYNSNFKILQDSQPQRYICEVKEKDLITTTSTTTTSTASRPTTTPTTSRPTTTPTTSSPTTTPTTSRPTTYPPENKCNQLSDSMELCLNAPYGCSFCSNPSFSNNERCDKDSVLIAKGCNRKEICGNGRDESPLKIITTPGSPISYSESVSYCPNSDAKIDVTFKMGGSGSASSSGPLDILFLVEKSNLLRINNEIVAQIRSLSSDARIGYAAFSDKTKSPFGSQASNFESWLKDPNPDHPFFLLNPLTTDFASVIPRINHLTAPPFKVGDLPGSQLDALSQSTCPRVGWRPHAKKIIMMFTQTPYHKAGDGIPYGMRPFDGQCHIGRGDYYDYPVQMVLDYPSENQIMNALQMNDIHVILAATQPVSTYYNYLGDVLRPLASLAILRPDGSNVGEILKQHYDIHFPGSNKVEIVVEGTAMSDLQVRSFSNCNSGLERETTVCDGIGPSDSVTFNLRVSMKNCKTIGEDLLRALIIKVKGYPNHVIVPVKLLCKKYSRF